MFQNSLTAAARHWFLNLDDFKTNNWGDICIEFSIQYNKNIEFDVT